MSDEIVLDFTDTPPASSRPPLAEVPDADYVLEVLSCESGMSKGNDPKPKITVRLRIAEGEYVDGEVEDTFSPVPRRSSEDSDFPTRRFHQFMLAIGKRPPTGKFKVDLSKFVGQRCTAHLSKNKMNASPDGKYPERIVSRPQSYEVKELAAAGATPAKTAPARQAAPPVLAAAPPPPLYEAPSTNGADGLFSTPAEMVQELDAAFP